MELSKFCTTRRYLFHTTAFSNLERIRKERRLLSTAQLVLLAPQFPSFSLSERRPVRATLELADGSVDVRDQDPLHQGNIAFEVGWDLERLVRTLNGLVFFWPGTSGGPVESGRNHADRYRGEGESLAFLRVESSVLLKQSSARFARVNSGSPRCVNGKKSYRGSNTFLPLTQFPGRPSHVVEVVFENFVSLPEETEWSANLNGDWQALWPKRVLET
jgi:hypothetical protein